MGRQRSPRSGIYSRPSYRRAGEGQRRSKKPALQKARTLAFERLESRTLLSADVGLTYQFDLNGAPVSSLSVGNTYVLDAYIRDNRSSFDATGILQAYFDGA